MTDFTVYPAIDLRRGEVVRLKEGDPGRQTAYSSDPEKIAELWMSAGSKWIHVVNLDGAFGEDGDKNLKALRKILEISNHFNGNIQFGGGMRDLASIESVLSTGVSRVVLGTLAVEKPEIVERVINEFGNEKIAVGIDARDGEVKTHGWIGGTRLMATDFVTKMREIGVRWIIFTDISRDGMQSGLNLESTKQLAIMSGLHVIASGGVRDWEDIKGAYKSGLAGVVVGRAIYEGAFNPIDLFKFPGNVME